jgi:hypothetical protein
VYEQGQVTSVDARALRQEARALMTDHAQSLQSASEEAKHLAVAYREMYLRAMQRDVGFSRRVDQSPVQRR